MKINHFKQSMMTKIIIIKLIKTILIYEIDFIKCLIEYFDSKFYEK